MKYIYPFLLLFCTFPVLSDTVENPCEGIEASQQIALCAEYKKARSDELLNLSYKATLDRIRHQYKQAPSLADQYISLLREAQRNWITLRDADCKLEAFEIEETAEAQQVTIDNCIARMSADRANYLKRIAPDI
ncbi:lysozyme inhibitor LprI family protein [Pseudomonas sp. Marseille-QA0892]